MVTPDLLCFRTFCVGVAGLSGYVALLIALGFLENPLKNVTASLDGAGQLSLQQHRNVAVLIFFSQKGVAIVGNFFAYGCSEKITLVQTSTSQLCAARILVPVLYVNLCELRILHI